MYVVVSEPQKGREDVILYIIVLIHYYGTYFNLLLKSIICLYIIRRYILSMYGKTSILFFTTYIYIFKRDEGTPSEPQNPRGIHETKRGVGALFSRLKISPRAVYIHSPYT
jgi:hypothetical protein